ncbi:MAG: hypothetical protein V7603_4041 [Micromonosporaceae bacterium]
MAPHTWTESLTIHKQRTREHILATAADLIAERGATDVSMSLLANRAGIARATLYNHFPDLERVLAALVAHEVALFLVQLDRHLVDAPDPVERLRRFLEATYRWATRQRRQRPPRTHRSPSRKLPPQVIAAMHEPVADLRAVLTAILTDGITTGDFPADIHPRLHAELILKLVLDPIAGPERSQTAARDQLVRFVHRGLTAPPTQP